MMIRKNTAILGVALLAAGGFATPASAQATRTWVSGVGDDVNPCSRTAPCKTFAGAISKTAAGGVINCLDPAGYGSVTINKSLSIICDYTEGGILSSLTYGITVNAGANDVILLSGLDFNGVTGTNGVNFIAGGTLHIRNSKIRGYTNTNGTGVRFAPSGSSNLYITDTAIMSNGNGAASAGVLIVPSGTGTAKVVLRNVVAQNNAGSAVKVDTTGNTGTGITVSIADSELSGSTVGFGIVNPASTAPVSATIDRTTISNNTVGIGANGATAVARVSNSTFFANTIGTSAPNGGAVRSYGNNATDGNGSAVTFTSTVTPN